MSRLAQGSLVVSSSPHVHSEATTQKIMLDVIIAMIPAIIMSAVVFGERAVLMTCVCAGASAAFEALYRKLMKKEQTVQDLSAIVTGILIALNVPVTLPFWQAVLGCGFAIIIVKQLFGGIGQNFVNPAIAARVFLLVSFATPMTTWSVTRQMVAAGVDATTMATPLGLLAEGAVDQLPSNLDLFLGFCGGSLGETSALALLIGGIYLVVRKVISPVIPVSYMATVALFALLMGQDPIFHLCAGGVMLGAIFMATDYTTAPLTTTGRIIFGVGCGFITMVIRLFGSYPEGVSFAIMLMNIITPHIDNLSRRKLYGGVKA
ncbi:MAG: RnfABCDGE type electron transport complex subunit D [Clostridiales bacterium]|nr:RnfABCDGE type electron transport complex subunit D [Clostridiales bacterium]MBQ3107166.1 RnfABCDGE type electron transport complex subunit D [Bacillota bacterium]